ncbi:MAG TPA: hypothetical protein VIZ59_05255, partial [Rubrobacteraceae bacterium]
LAMTAGVSPQNARLVRIQNTLKLRQMWVSEALLEEARDDERLRILEDVSPMDFDQDGSLL